MATYQIGKATLSISVEGCVQCGTRWSSAWTLAREVPLSIGAKKTVVRLHLCAQCQPPSQGETEPLSTNGRRPLPVV